MLSKVRFSGLLLLSDSRLIQPTEGPYRNNRSPGSATEEAQLELLLRTVNIRQQWRAGHCCGRSGDVKLVFFRKGRGSVLMREPFVITLLAGKRTSSLCVHTHRAAKNS